MSIIEIITIPFFNLIAWFFNLIPTVTLPTSFLEAIDTGVGYLITLGYFVPLATLSGIIFVYISWYFFKLTIYMINFCIQYIPILRRK